MLVNMGDGLLFIPAPDGTIGDEKNYVRVPVRPDESLFPFLKVGHESVGGGEAGLPVDGVEIVAILLFQRRILGKDEEVLDIRRLRLDELDGFLNREHFKHSSDMTVGHFVGVRRPVHAAEEHRGWAIAKIGHHQMLHGVVVGNKNDRRLEGTDGLHRPLGRLWQGCGIALAVKAVDLQVEFRPGEAFPDGLHDGIAGAVAQVIGVDVDYARLPAKAGGPGHGCGCRSDRRQKTSPQRDEHG
ncbi:MAG: hypothetical protein U5J83_06975 [Bryobacterales bacterium]|nr:hypothetical protein [Bryobacterales bacterium]